MLIWSLNQLYCGDCVRRNWRILKGFFLLIICFGNKFLQSLVLSVVELVVTYRQWAHGISLFLHRGSKVRECRSSGEGTGEALVESWVLVIMVATLMIQGCRSGETWVIFFFFCVIWVNSLNLLDLNDGPKWRDDKLFLKV